MSGTKPLLEICDLHIAFRERAGGDPMTAIDGVSLSVSERETFGLIGESGSGKSVLGMSILRLLPGSAEVEGTIVYDGEDLTQLSEKRLRRLRGGSIGLVPQNPATSLNPVLRIGRQVSEPLRLHRRLSRQQAAAKLLELLDRLGLPDPKRTSRRYPWQLSGGMKQRVLTAIGIAGSPRLLIADEPTKGLDAILRKQVVELLANAAKESGAAMLVITHDLQVAAKLCNRVGVIYAGQLVEAGPAAELFARPLHPYTAALLTAAPNKELKPIPGISPGPGSRPEGCAFHPRCPYAMDRCRRERPVPSSGAQHPDRYVRCWLYE